MARTASALPSIHNADIARAFDEMADLIELEGGNPFRVRAYRNAARVVGEMALDIAAAVAAGAELPKTPGLGADLAGKAREIASTGHCAVLDELRGHFPAGIVELLRLPGLGPKRVAQLHSQLRVSSLEDLRRAAREGRLRGLARFGEALERKVLEAADARANKARRFKIAFAAQYAEPLARHLGAVVAGSYRRMRETVGDLDFLAASAAPARVIERLVRHPEVKEVIARGTTKATVVLQCGIQCDLRVVPPESFGAALHYFTGSKAHNIAVRRIGMARGLKINEYGVFRGARRIAGATEASVYGALDLPFIEPELREDRGELEAAAEGRLPHLVELADLRGDLHVHTDASDGRASLEAMVEAARARGLRYVAITDHSRHLAMAHGLDPRRLARQCAAIDALDAHATGIAVLKGIEVDILGDGSLDLPDTALAKLDVVVAAVHSQLQLPRERQTARVLAALDNPHLGILAHPSGRLIGERAPMDIDMEAVIRKAAQLGVVLEINAHPDRLDLDDSHCRMARDAGALLAIGSDAHGPDGFDVLRYGVGQARRGWLGREHVVNTRSASQVLRALSRLDAGGRDSPPR